jgi:hypothetical protein
MPVVLQDFLDVLGTQVTGTVLQIIIFVLSTIFITSISFWAVLYIYAKVQRIIKVNAFHKANIDAGMTHCGWIESFRGDDNDYYVEGTFAEFDNNRDNAMTRRMVTD